MNPAGGKATLRSMPRESRAARARRAHRIQEILARTYPDAYCALHYDTPFQLLIATILSAQCTDQKVNEVTAVLFRDHCTAPCAQWSESSERLGGRCADPLGHRLRYDTC